MFIIAYLIYIETLFHPQLILFVTEPLSADHMSMFTYDPSIKTLFEAKELSVEASVKVQAFDVAECTRTITAPTIIATLCSSISNFYSFINDVLIPSMVGETKPLLFLSFRSLKDLGRHQIPVFSVSHYCH